MTPFKPDHLFVVSLWSEEVTPMIHFYRDIVGLSLLPHHGHRPAFDLGNGSHLVIVEEPTPLTRQLQKSSFPVIAFTVADLDEAVEHLRSYKIDMPWGIEDGIEERWVKFFDPAGNLIEFVQFN
jgi:catechol-2,3-dioxygenase